MSSEKKRRRLEAKKRKIQAFLEIAGLNDADRAAGNSKEDPAEPSAPKKFRITDKPEVSGEELVALRAKLRARKKALQQFPKFDLKSTGYNASVEILPSQRTPLFLSDLRNILSYAMIGDRTSFQPYKWCKLEKWNRLSHVLCLVVEGLSVEDFLNNRESNESVMEIDKTFKDKLEFVSAKSYFSTTAQELSILPVSKTKQKQLKSKYKNMTEVQHHGEAFKVYRSMFPIKTNPATNESRNSLKLCLLLSAPQMLEEGYPLPMDGMMKEKYSDYVLTKDVYKEVNPDSPMFSIDCEMCRTETKQLELTRICVMDENLKVVYHTLVKPKSKITNYLTQFSGITEEILMDVSTTLEEVQQNLREILPPDCILLGQSLNADLHALKMMHPYVIDTSVIFNITGHRRKKTKLATLSMMFLGEEIQMKGKEGHNPVEDAQAAMKLVNLKLEKGYEFGDVILNGEIPNLHESPKEQEKSFLIGKSVLDLLKANEKKFSVVCHDNIKNDYLLIPKCDEFVHTESSAKAAVKKASDTAANTNLTFCHIKVDQNDEERFRKVQKFTKKLWRHTQNKGMFFTVWAGKQSENAFVGINLRKPDRESIIQDIESS